VHEHFGAAARRLKPEHRRCIDAAAPLRVGALRRNARRVGLAIDLLELDDPRESQRHRPEPHADFPFVGIQVEHLGQLSTRHARRDPINVEQYLPRLGRWQRHFE